MFTSKETRKENKATAFSTQKRHEKGEPGSPVVAGNFPGSTYFLQRYLGNSYTQSIAENRHRSRQIIIQTGVPTIQRKCACGGSCSSCADKEDETSKIQPKLTIGPVNDVYEQEADRVAEQIMRMSESSTQTENEQPNAGINIQRIAATDGGTLESYQDVKLNKSGGRPLSSSTRKFMEPRFGVNFGHVRLHTDQDAHQTVSQ